MGEGGRWWARSQIIRPQEISLCMWRTVFFYLERTSFFKCKFSACRTSTGRSVCSGASGGASPCSSWGLSSTIQPSSHLPSKTDNQVPSFFFIHFDTHGADPLPPSSHVATPGKNKLNKEITPPPPHWDGRAILPNHIKFRTWSALAPILTSPINESALLTHGAL